MAKGISVWGIDIGQCALKALRCSKQGNEVVAEAFDYIEYPKMLSQPESEPEKLVHEALEKFLSRNDIKDCKIAMSVPGQSGLAKFFKPPPVDAKKIPDIVKYEAKQQIPFDLNDVIWDFQQMGGGAEVDGFALEAEVGLFAMKRDQVFRAIRPFQEVDIALDIVQLAPIAIYNFVAYDLLAGRGEEFDPDNPPESMVVLAMGTETTDLVVTNGFRLWQRSIPLGGNHFTKQLTKDMKLTFAKAEHLKRNARQTEDPKAVFQAMRPVFNDMVTEVQRSIGYFQGIDRKAKIGGVVLLGNTVRLPGLTQYLGKNLGFEVVKFDSFSRLTGSSVVSSPAFRDNVLAFCASYGLCLQGLHESQLRTNLIPRELITQRLIRAKKPWALACVAALMFAFAINFFFVFKRWYAVQPTKTVGGITWQDAEKKISSVADTSSRHEQEDKNQKDKLTRVKQLGNQLVGNDRRLMWMELLSAIDQLMPPALPGRQDIQPGQYLDPKSIPYIDRQDIHIHYIESQHFEKLGTWFDEGVAARYVVTAAELAALRGPAAVAELAAAKKPEKFPLSDKPGWVIEVQGHHFYNDDSTTERYTTGRHYHVFRTLINALENGRVVLPIPNGPPTEFTTKELGISYPVLLDGYALDAKHREPNPLYTGPTETPASTGTGTTGTGSTATAATTPATTPATSSPEKVAASNEPRDFAAPKFTFTVQFVWIEKPLTERFQEREKAADKKSKPDDGQGKSDKNTVAANQGSH